MVTKLIVYLLIPNLALTELNSDELKDREKKIKYVEILLPYYFLNEFVNDEQGIIDKEIDRDLTGVKDIVDVDGVNYYGNKLTIISPNNTKHKNNLGEDKVKNKTQTSAAELESVKKKMNTKGKDHDTFVFYYPKEMEMKIKNLEFDNNNDLSISIRAKEKTLQSFDDLQGAETNVNPIKRLLPSEDVVVFKFSDEVNSSWKDIRTVKQTTTSTATHHSYNDKLLEENIPLKINQTAAENICTYLKKTECYERNGLIYNLKSSKSIKFTNAFFVCCILSLGIETKHEVVPDPEKEFLKRSRRSNKNVSSLSQREILLRNKFGTQSTEPSAPLTKTVTPDEDFFDPYWNIKNSNFKSAYKQGIRKQESYEDYVEDYIVELPKPGLVGIYSDNGNKEPGWTNEYENPNPSYGVNDDYSEENIGGTFGYSTIDPRRVTSSKSQKRRPVKITTEPPEEESTFDIESQTVNFQSNPNFQVLHGFKILNLGRTKSKYMKNSKRSTTESSVESNSGERGGEQQVFKQCGKTSDSKEESEASAEINEAETGSHPWLAVVVPSRRPQDVLCYATIIHPRATVTAGDCVSDFAKMTSGKDVLVIVAGLSEIKDTSDTQNRIVTVQMHPQRRRDNLAHNLALLHWNRPLRLSANVQPACVSRYHDYDDCKFYGWGGFDQAIRQRARWQKASVVSSNKCNAFFSKKTKLSADAFCATVKSRGTVTGIGGSLICNIDGHATSVGVAVYRDRAIVLIPAHEWILRAMDDLNIE